MDNTTTKKKSFSMDDSLISDKLMVKNLSDAIDAYHQGKIKWIK